LSYGGISDAYSHLYSHQAGLLLTLEVVERKAGIVVVHGLQGLKPHEDLLQDPAAARAA
jgi:hypothetical protein